MAPTKFSADDVKAAMADTASIRNVGMVGPIGVGKTCGVDCLGAQCGLVAEDKIGEARFTAVRQDEREKSCTLKATLASMIVDGTLLHCVDTPGHSEYVAELQCVAPLIDGALFTVDGSKSELASQCQQQVAMCKDKIITPVLFCNKLDISLMITKKPEEEILDDLMGLVTSFNEQIGDKDDGSKIERVNAAKGSVLIGSLLNGWAFTIPQFAGLYAKKFGSDVESLSDRIWGDNYFNPKTKKFTKSSQEGAVRGFVQFVLKPIKAILESADAGNADKIENMLKGFGVAMSAADKALSGPQLFHRAMQLWMPAGPCIAKALKDFVPNPSKAQAVRFEAITQGSPSDASNVAVKACKRDGTFIFQVGKLVPQPSAAGRFYAMGRVFAGTLSADKCWVLPEDYLPPQALEGEGTIEESEAAAGGESPGGDATEVGPAPAAAKASKGMKLEERRIQGVVSCCAKTFNAMASVPAGNLCAVSGIDQYVLKRCTLTNSKDAWSLPKPTITVSPVVKVALGPKSAADLPKMVEGLRRLSKSCPIVVTSMEDNGQHVMAACGQEHMRVLKNDLENEYLPGIGIQWDDPSISYRETVTGESSMMCLSKSPNKHNRLFVKAEPMNDALCTAIESGKIFQNQDAKIRSKLLEKEYEWEKTDALKIWSFGPAPEEAGKSYGANVLVDQTKAVQYLHEIRESVNSGLLWASRQSVLAEENMRGIRFNLHDVKLHSDSIHRGMGQIQPTARRVLFAATLTAEPRFQEPVFVASISAPADSQPGIMQALGACRGEFVESEDQGGNVVIKAYVPIAETIGKMPFASVLSQKTNGKAFANYAFDHWQTMPSDPLKLVQEKSGNKEWKADGSRAAEILLEIRKRKGLQVQKPDLVDYYDKL
jgi:elongation factor 2